METTVGVTAKETDVVLSLYMVTILGDKTHSSQGLNWSWYERG